MAKDRYAITCNGRPAFYASMYEDIRKCTLDCGWAVALHGSLSSDMDIMAMPWIEDAVSFEELIKKLSELFVGNISSENYFITYNEKPHNRVVATIPIFADFYLDISTIRFDGNFNESINKQKRRLSQRHNDSSNLWQYYTGNGSNPCGCGSNCFHYEYDKVDNTIYGVCNACNKDIYVVREEYKEEKLKEGKWVILDEN